LVYEPDVSAAEDGEPAFVQLEYVNTVDYDAAIQASGFAARQAGGFAARQAGGFAARQAGGSAAITCVRPIHAADDVHERGLAGARRAHYRRELALFYAEAHAGKRRDCGVALSVSFSYVANLQDGHVFTPPKNIFDGKKSRRKIILAALCDFTVTVSVFKVTVLSHIITALKYSKRRTRYFCAGLITAECKYRLRNIDALCRCLRNIDAIMPSLA